MQYFLGVAYLQVVRQEVILFNLVCWLKNAELRAERQLLDDL
jgi:hypothetical protein